MGSLVNRWYYVKDPVFPEKDSNGKRFHFRSLYLDVVKVVKENPGLTGSEIAQKLGRPAHSVTPLLWNLRKYCGAVEFKKHGFIRIPGLEQFTRVPYVARMLDKLGSEKTKRPWLRRLFHYEQWLKQKKYFNSISELLEDFKQAKTEEAKYRHLDLLQEYVNSWKADKDTKDSVVTVIRGFYRKNRTELPREKITFNSDMLTRSPHASEEYVKPEEIWRIISDGRVPVRDKAIIATLLFMGLDESTFVEQFNYYAYPQLVNALGEKPSNWDLNKAPIRINLVRSKNGYKYYNFLPRKCLELLKDWLNIRKSLAGSDIKIHSENGIESSDPIFVSAYKRAVDEKTVRSIVRESSFKSGVQQRVLGVKRYRIHGHEFRDTFKTTSKIAGVDGAVSEFFLGHSIDKLGYDKSPWVYPEHFRTQYQKVEPYLSGEEQRFVVQEEKRKELEERIKSLESSLSRLTSELSLQVSAQHQSRNGDTSNGNNSQKKIVKANEIERYINEGWEPMMTLPDGRIIMKAVT
jgi:integrase